MELNGIENFGAPTLMGIDFNGARAGQRLQTSARQYVRFYNKTTSELKASKITVKQNPSNGTVVETPKEFVAEDVTREWVHIVTPGDKNEIDTIAELDHKREFWREYQAFREGRTAPVGTPLEKLSFVPAHIATELNVRKVFTAEQLADLPEYLCGQIPEGYQLREFAKAYVRAQNSNQSNAQVVTLKHELAQKDNQLADMERRIQQMQDMIYGKSRVSPAAALSAEPVKVERIVEIEKEQPEAKPIKTKKKKAENETLEETK